MSTTPPRDDLPPESSPTDVTPLADDAPLPAGQSPPFLPAETGRPTDEYVSSGVTGEEEGLIDGELVERRRRVWLPLVLFFVTCFTTFCAGCYHWLPTMIGSPDLEVFPRILAENWVDGLIFMISVMGVLLFHEMGHFLMTLRYRIPASFPYFIPFPIMVTGTMGAVIGMEGYRANRKQLFDIGLAGPLAGLVLIVPFVIYGLSTAEIRKPPPRNPQNQNEVHLEFGDPLFVKLLVPVLRDVEEGEAVYVNPIYMAGWVGMLVTGLNMLPISQLDGGHVIHAVFGRSARWIARLVLGGAILFIWYFRAWNWMLMLLLVLMIGIDHPPTADDTVNIGWPRRIIGLASLAIPVLCFPPFPLQIH